MVSGLLSPVRDSIQTVSHENRYSARFFSKAEQEEAQSKFLKESLKKPEREAGMARVELSKLKAVKPMHEAF